MVRTRLRSVSPSVGTRLFLQMGSDDIAQINTDRGVAIVPGNPPVSARVANAEFGPVVGYA